MDRTKIYSCPTEFDRGEKNNLIYDDTIGKIIEKMEFFSWTYRQYLSVPIFP